MHNHESIWEVLLHALLHTLPEMLRLLPFLFLTYLVMELLEHKAGERIEGALRRSGKLGPLVGGLLGAVPQCGFSAAASGFYAGRVISVGTLVAVFLATSDEMIPVAIAGNASPLFIFKLLGLKVAIGVLFGFVIDLLARHFRPNQEEHIEELCEEEGCHCENGILRSSIYHTLKIGLFLFLVMLLLNTVIEGLGESALGNLFISLPVLGPAVAALVGLIPNCASSVVITKLYLSGVISAGCLLSGLLSGAGIGILILFRINHRRMKENLLVLLLVFLIGTLCGSLADLFGLGAFLRP